MNTTTIIPLSNHDNRTHLRAYRLIAESFNEILDFCELDKRNYHCFGHNQYALLLRICTEFEALCKLARTRWGVQERTDKKGLPVRLNISDYAELNDLNGVWCRDSCVNLPSADKKLSSYKFMYFCQPDFLEVEPLVNFSKSVGERTPAFYESYNAVKHNRANKFENASLEVLLQGFSALTAVLDWQGFVVNEYVISDCSNEIQQGAKFGYFSLGSSQAKKDWVWF